MIAMDLTFAKSNVNMYSFWWRDFIAENILYKKYYHDNEQEEFDKGNKDTAFDMFVKRVCSILNNEDDKVFLHDAIYRGDFILAGRSLYGAGAKGKFKSSLSNCYILPSPDDNLESIFDVATKMARIFSYGGGCGVDISKLRPRDSKVMNVARSSSGAVSFMNIFSVVGETIAQQNRRGAILIGLDCMHPDVEEFLTIKQNNDKVQGANISIKFTDEFMQAVEQNKEVNLYFKVKSTGEEITKTINARYFFMLFATVQHDWAEPAALFIDTVRKWNLLSEYEDYKIDITNPCVTGDTLVLTDKGNIPIKDLVDKEVNVWNGSQWSKVTPKVTGHNQKLLNVQLSDGSHILCTPYHKFVLLKRKRVEAKDLKVGDKLAKFYYPILNNKSLNSVPSYYTAGFYCGDGTTGKKEILLYNEKVKLQQYLDVSEVIHTSYSSAVKVILNNNYDKQFVPCDMDSIKNKLEYLAGLCDSDGCINSSEGSIAISSIHKDFLTKVKMMLSTMGVKSSVALMRDGGLRPLPTHTENGDYKEYECKPCYRLLISASNVSILMRLGFNPYRLKIKCNPNRDASRFLQVTNIVEFGEADTVYCMNEPINHTFIANGVMVGNCAEFAGNAYNSCNLSSINLYNFVVNPYTELAYFDFDKFTNTVFNAVSVANQVLDYGYDTQPLNLNRKCIDDWRSIGIGVFGIADMLVALGIKYGNGNSKDLIKHIAYEMQKSALFSSAMYAKKHGSFGKFDLLKTMNSDFFKNIAEPNSAAYNAVLDYGLANGTLLSIAPTGSIAMLFRESGGIEPYYQVSYERTTHQLEKEHKKFFISMLGVDNLLKFNNIKDITADEIKKRFPFVVDTYDIEPYDRVDMQSAMQEYVDNAISSTINLKEDASITDIFNLYVRAWLLKCKGITIFRDNCKRISILGKNHGKTRDNEKDTMITKNGAESMTTKVNDTPIPVDNSKPKMNSIMPNKRGKNIKSLWGRTFLYHTACVPKFYVTVNIKDGEIFEVFVGADKGCQANISTITRLTSLALRGGIKVDEIVKNLNSAICPACTNVRQKGDTTVNKSCASCIASAIIEMQKTIEGGKNILKMADEMDFKEVDKVPDDVKMEKIEIHNNKMECPECGKATLIPDGKCCYCSNCGYSKCD